MTIHVQGTLGSTPFAVLPRSAHLVPVGAARPVSRDTVRAWLAKQEGA